MYTVACRMATAHREYLATLLRRDGLTERQWDILLWIGSYIAEHGWPPTVREIGAAFAISSPNGVMCHLTALETKKRIRRETGRGRAIALEEIAWAPEARPVPLTALEVARDGTQGNTEDTDEAGLAAVCVN
jgi:SOS-response transcriptional repressor LexA